MGDDADDAWSNLVLWLKTKGMKEHLLVHSKSVPGAGRGLFAVRDIPPNTPLFTVPKSAHMNLGTLRPLYKSTPMAQALTATQMISMHIFLHHPSIERLGGWISRDPEFGPYITIFPRDFQGHPLTWKVYPQDNIKDCNLLLSSMPPGASSALKTMEARFWADWKTVAELLNKHPNIGASTRNSDICFSPFIPEHHVPRYLWAWLNVNTRCIYSQISASTSDSDNITLCPVLDLANHASSSVYQPRISPIPTFFSPSDHSLKQEQEVYLRYGSHSNSTLFTEYGFTEAHPETGEQGDVQDIVERLFQRKGILGEWMRTTLMDENYWGDWKLYGRPSPAHPSYRLLPALRLLHLSLPSSLQSGVTFDDTPDLALWRETLLGSADVVSAENENLVWNTLEEICNESAQRAEERFLTLKDTFNDGQMTGWMKCATEAILNLWLEEKSVSQAVHQTIATGETVD